MMEYFILINGKQVGPIALEKMLEHGLTKETLVWTQGMDDWKPAGLVPEVAELFKQMPPPPPQNIVTEQPMEDDEDVVEEFDVEEPSFKRYLKYIIPLFILVVMFFTCPDEAKHKEVIAKKITTSLVMDSADISPEVKVLGTFFMPAITEIVLNNLLLVNNYGLISVGTVDGTPVSIGAFGNVFVLKGDKLDAKKYIDKIKQGDL